MTDASNVVVERDRPDSPAEQALIAHLSSGRWSRYARVLASALGSIPWVGSVLTVAATLSAEHDQARLSELQRLWLEEHRVKIQQLGATLEEIFTRLDGFGDEVQARIESEEYLALVRRAFRSWDQADTDSKRDMYKRLILNAGATKLCSDHLIRLFIGWLDIYHEAHFTVIREVFQNPGSTRGEMWDRLHPGDRPREDSSEADLFKYLIRDLSLGGVLRQERDTDDTGHFLKKRAPTARQRPSGSGTRLAESAFEDTKPYELTELGKEFVHYVMKDVAQQLDT